MRVYVATENEARSAAGRASYNGENVHRRRQAKCSEEILTLYAQGYLLFGVISLLLFSLRVKFTP